MSVSSPFLINLFSSFLFILLVKSSDLKVQMKCFFLFPNLKEQQKSGRLPFTVS